MMFYRGRLIIYGMPSKREADAGSEKREKGNSSAYRLVSVLITVGING